MDQDDPDARICMAEASLRIQHLVGGLSAEELKLPLGRYYPEDQV